MKIKSSIVAVITSALLFGLIMAQIAYSCQELNCMEAKLDAFFDNITIINEVNKCLNTRNILKYESDVQALDDLIDFADKTFEPIFNCPDEDENCKCVIFFKMILHTRIIKDNITSLQRLIKSGVGANTDNNRVFQECIKEIVELTLARIDDILNCNVKMKVKTEEPPIDNNRKMINFIDLE